eukprot:GFUD01007731.1.p1 GENE.GFUD01007731.1~~GFUD01007731.1.p1  ORF type:complete len:504 (-),score=114.69 GFUD01007731.1:154-1665(-)
MLKIYLLLFLSFRPDTASPLSQSCISSMGKFLNLTSFPASVAHGVHSLTVEDVRFYFNPNVGDQIKIPTINQNLSGDVLLEYLPNAHYDEEFTTMAMKNLDMVMRNMNNEDFSIRGLNTLEKISHVLHMQELWQEAGKAYQEFAKNPPMDPKFCACVGDVGENEVLDAMIQMAERIRREELDKEEILNEVRTKRSPSAKRYNTFSGDHRADYSDYTPSYSQALSSRQKRSPIPARMYNTFDGGPKYEYFYSDYKGKQALSKRQKRSPSPARMYNTFDGGPKYEYFYSDYKGKQALSSRQKRSPVPARMYNTFNGGPNYVRFYSDYSASQSLSAREKRSPEPKRYNTFNGGDSYVKFYSDYSPLSKDNLARDKRSPDPKRYNTFDGGDSYVTFYSDYSASKANLARSKRSPDPKRYNTFTGGDSYVRFYSDYSEKNLARQKRSTEEASKQRSEAGRDPNMPELSDATTWKKWKAMLQRSMLKEDEKTNLAAFMYCALKKKTLAM